MVVTSLEEEIDKWIMGLPMDIWTFVAAASLAGPAAGLFLLERYGQR